jgi:3',5'-cyclic AMP phosphodiesterase CpdA
MNKRSSHSAIALLLLLCVHASRVLAQAPTFTVPSSEIPHHWTIIVYGDTRFTDPANVKAANPKARRSLVAKIAQEKPDAVLVSGDLPYKGSDPADYDVFRAETRAWSDQHIRLFPALGNHEFKDDEQAGLRNWWNAFPALKGRRWYSVGFRNAYFLLLDSDSSLTDGSEQRRWFAEQIAHLPSGTEFVWVVFHHPPLADGGMNADHTPKPNEVDFAHFLEQQAKQLPTHFIVVTGHIHNYERFSEQGVDYLIAGGGGASPHPVTREPRDLYQDTAFPNFHYVKFTFDGRQLTATMVRLADPEADAPRWEAKDSFSIAPSATASAAKRH